MEFIAEEKYRQFGRIDSFNTSDGIINMNVKFSDMTIGNIKITEQAKESFELQGVYLLVFTCHFNGVRNYLVLEEAENIFAMDLTTEVEDALRAFYAYSPVTTEHSLQKLNSFIRQIKNRNIRDITKEIIRKREKKFLLYPAATRMHHAYMGGLIYHCLSMCELVDEYVRVYPYLNKDYLIAGILLHDIAKIDELSAPLNPVYTLKGQLLGHLVMGVVEVEEVAKELGIKDTEEVLILQHIMASHHGQPQFGAIKKPLTAEALLIWFLDNIDAKLRVLEEEMAEVTPGEFTEALQIIDKTKFYKTKN